MGDPRVPSERGKSVIDIERETLQSLIQSGTSTSFGDMTNHGRPATYFTTDDGTFMVTIQRISKAIQRTDSQLPIRSVADGTA